MNGIGLVNSYQNRFEFLGREKESTYNLNMIRLGARGFNPTTGRFDSIDPIPDIEGQESLSTYQYGWNNPVLRSDPNGDCPECYENVKKPANGQEYTSSGGAKYAYSNGSWTRNGGDLKEVVVRPQGAYGSGLLSYSTQTKGVVAGFSTGYIGASENGSVEGNVTGFRAEYSNTTGTGDLNLAMEGSAKVTALQATGSGKIGDNDNNLSISGKGNVFVAEAKGNAGILTGENKKRGVSLGGELGAQVLKGEINPSISIGGFKLGGTISPTLVGAQVGAGVGIYHDGAKGTFHVNAFVSAAFGAGGKLGFQITIPDFKKIKFK